MYTAQRVPEESLKEELARGFGSHRKHLLVAAMANFANAFNARSFSFPRPWAISRLRISDRLDGDRPKA